MRGKAKPDDGDKTYLYRGIAGRAFERKFQLADYIHVSGANLANGLLHIMLKREVPEALRPRTIEISKGAPKQIETRKAAYPQSPLIKPPSPELGGFLFVSPQDAPVDPRKTDTDERHADKMLYFQLLA